MLTARFLYTKFVGFLMVVLGFSYCMTSFYNFYEYVFGKISIANSNVFIMMLGLLIPLYMFIFGIYFYLYADKNITKINKFILITALMFVIVGMLCILLNNTIIYTNLFFIAQVTEFLHISVGYSMIILGIMMIYGCIKYKY